MFSEGVIPKREYAAGVELSILGLGGVVVMGMDQDEADYIVTEAVERGVNYFDVAPSYGDGEAEEKLGIALEPYRDEVFLACKTTCRDAEGAQQELERSLERLHTEHFDLYQFHSVKTIGEVKQIFGPGGAMEVFLEAQDEGLVDHIGFSAHTVEAALAMMDRYEFDSVLFPINFVCYAHGNFGPQVVEKAGQKRVARLALKAMAHTVWPQGEGSDYPKSWYKPTIDPWLAQQALRFTLSQDITAAVGPGDERLFRLALDLAEKFEPLTAEERERLLASAERVEPIFPRSG